MQWLAVPHHHRSADAGLSPDKVTTSDDMDSDLFVVTACPGWLQEMSGVVLQLLVHHTLLALDHLHRHGIIHRQAPTARPATRSTST